MENAIKALYLKDVLGIKNYLCPELLWDTREIKGPWPCQALAVVLQKPNKEENQILKKIMISIQQENFSLLYIKQNQFLNSFLSWQEKQSLIPFVIFFDGGDSFNEQSSLSSSNHSTFVRTYSLQDLLGDSPQVRKRKQQFWGVLQQWNK